MTRTHGRAPRGQRLVARVPHGRWTTLLDNLGSHKGAAVRRAIRAAGAHLLFLPPYSPDLNPIEQVFAKLKTLLRKADERSIAAVWHRIGNLLNAFSPQECQNYFSHAGYASTVAYAVDPGCTRSGRVY
jgi:transposase